ncbi:hypothetical protein B0J13DRAFT_521043 [Dactylonectria estremocensis]|uniref:Uncharacterized protein n=1 Tax=Dactylonectria estremocensis TaxID=1079267 RepID=A0A9P9F6U4_9HYPO|nr:hypothetical protein B0J13DRAFT_521043 [Dactylonectria estremocensis]
MGACGGETGGKMESCRRLTFCSTCGFGCHGVWINFEAIHSLVENLCLFRVEKETVEPRGLKASQDKTMMRKSFKPRAVWPVLMLAGTWQILGTSHNVVVCIREGFYNLR